MIVKRTRRGLAILLIDKNQKNNSAPVYVLLVKTHSNSGHMIFNLGICYNEHTNKGGKVTDGIRLGDLR